MLVKLLSLWRNIHIYPCDWQCRFISTQEHTELYENSCCIRFGSVCEIKKKTMLCFSRLIGPYEIRLFFILIYNRYTYNMYNIYSNMYCCFCHYHFYCCHRYFSFAFEICCYRSESII